jgi:hypothetical protein
MEVVSADTARNRERIFERRIIHWCAPTLVGAKPANLFTFVFEDGPACRSCSAEGCRYRRCRYLCEELDGHGMPLEQLARMDEKSMEAAVRAA